MAAEAISRSVVSACAVAIPFFVVYWLHASYVSDLATGDGYSETMAETSEIVFFLCLLIYSPIALVLMIRVIRTLARRLVAGA